MSDAIREAFERDCGVHPLVYWDDEFEQYEPKHEGHSEGERMADHQQAMLRGYKAALQSQTAPAVPSGGEALERPLGAAHNGRILADRIENNYDFACEGGSIAHCYEWQELRRCIECLAEYVEDHPAPPSVAVPEDGQALANMIKDAHMEGQKSATGREGTEFRWAHSDAKVTADILLTAAPQPDHIADAGKVMPVAIPDSEFDETNPIHQAADAYSYACEIMEQHQAERVDAGKDPGTIGSLCDGIAWLYEHIQELEDAPSVPEEDAGKVATIQLDPRYQEPRPLITNAMKADHIGEYQFTVDTTDAFGNEVTEQFTVPWDTCKAIYKGMAKTAMRSCHATLSVPEEEVRQLEEIRSLIEGAPIDALGTGTANNCEPWPIRDEVIYNISRVIDSLRAAGDDGEGRQ